MSEVSEAMGKAAQLHFVPILATPLGLAAVPDAEQLNPALYALFARRAAADRRPGANPHGSDTRITVATHCCFS